MKINEKTRFPHPILSEDTRDFEAGYMEVEFGVREENVTDTLFLKPAIKIEHSLFRDAIADGKLKIVADIHCKETYYNELRELKNLTEEEFVAGSLSGRVVIKPLLLAVEKFEVDAPEDLDSEFSLQKIHFDSGEIVGWAGEHIIYVGRRKLAPMDTIFSLSRNDDLKEGVFEVDPGQDKIQISAASKTYENIDQMRKQSKTQAVIINSVYLPAIMQVLDSVRNSDDFANYDWYRTFKAKCDFYNINLENCDPLRDAQILLKSPYLRLEESFDE